MKLVNAYILTLILVTITAEFHAARSQVWTLEQCLDTALRNNANLQMSRNNIMAGEQKEMEALAGRIPKITAMADYKYFINLPYQLMPLSTFNPLAPDGQFMEAQFGVPHNLNVNLQLTMPLYNPQIYGAIERSKIASEINQLQHKKTVEQISFEITNLYYNAKILYHQLEFLDTNLIHTHRLLTQMLLLHEQQLAKGTDVSKIKLQEAQLTTQRQMVRNTYEQVLNTLKFTIGISTETNFQIDPAIEFQEANDYSLSAPAEVQLIKTNIQIISSEVTTLSKTRWLPSVNLYALYGTNGLGYDKKPNDFLNFYPAGFAGVQISYSLFNGTVTQRKINQKKLELNNNELQFRQVSELNTLQINNTKNQKKVAQSSAKTLYNQIELAETIYNQTLLQHKEGTAGLTEILLADIALREARQYYLNAVIEYMKADLELKKLTGNLALTK